MAEESRGVGRLLMGATLILVLIGGIAAWLSLGFYQLPPGRSAVVLRLGAHVYDEPNPGLRWHWPPPIETHEIIEVAKLNMEVFGYRADSAAEPSEQERVEAAMQTSDNNIVHVSFVVQYRIKDAFASRYQLADPLDTLRDAAQASLRDVVGRNTIDDVLSEKRGVVEDESAEILQNVLDDYQSGLQIDAVELQDVQPPPAVRAAFDDVLAAFQDRNRAMNEAEGYANEVLPAARARAIEAVASARGYRDATIAEATGKAARFSALAGEYVKEPEVVRTRLFLETMEEVLPRVNTVIMEPGTGVLPYLPLERSRGDGR